jgi:hypothetical protein
MASPRHGPVGPGFPTPPPAAARRLPGPGPPVQPARRLPAKWDMDVGQNGRPRGPQMLV